MSILSQRSSAFRGTSTHRRPRTWCVWLLLEFSELLEKGTNRTQHKQTAMWPRAVPLPSPCRSGAPLNTHVHIYLESIRTVPVMTDGIDVVVLFVCTGFALDDCCLLRSLMQWTCGAFNPSPYDRRVNGYGGGIWNLHEHVRPK